MSMERLQERFVEMAFVKFLGVEVCALAPQRALLRLPFRDDYANPNGSLHGGATASLLNLAGALAVWTDVDLAVASLLQTVDFSIELIAIEIMD